MGVVVLTTIQADIIYKALHYVATNEGLEIPGECDEAYKILAEYNPRDTHSNDVVDVMEYLLGSIKNSDDYKEYFLQGGEEDEI